mmetsp:Transcript_10801/g.20797  ORF Transcript_10801/g.20797 Transcript_10801/m.20797 type:complete len:284 (-) Transcript_10801:9-860(-)
MIRLGLDEFLGADLGGGKFLTHGINGLLVRFDRSRFFENGGSSNKHVHTSFADFLNVVYLDTTVNFQSAVHTGFVNHLARFPGLVQRGWDESLSTETGVDGHEKDNVKLVHHVLGIVESGGRVKDKSSLASTVLDQLQRSVNVVRGFRVEGDVGGTGIDKVADDGVNRRNHQVNIDRGGDTMVTESLAHHRANGQVRDVVVVHDVKVNNVGTGFQHVVDFSTELGKVGRENGGSDKVVLISPHIQRSLGTSRLLRSGKGRGGSRKGEQDGGSELHDYSRLQAS